MIKSKRTRMLLTVLFAVFSAFLLSFSFSVVAMAEEPQPTPQVQNIKTGPTSAEIGTLIFDIVLITGIAVSGIGLIIFKIRKDRNR